MFALTLGAGQLFASTREQRDFAAAAAAFKDSMWSRAEVEFAQFAANHPQSALVPQAILLQAQADFKQAKLIDAVTLLQTRESSSGGLADQYTYWIGLAQFQNADYSEAADTFAQLVQTFPASQWRLDAVVNEAVACSKLGQWSQAITLLQNPDGFFQESARTNATDSRVLNGQLLLAKSLLAENQPAAAATVLQSSTPFKHNADLDWQRLYLLCQAQLSAGNTNGALALTTNLITIANNSDRRAQAMAEQADILQKTGRLAAAQAVYEENLANNAPPDWQRQAILKIADLSAAQTNYSDAQDSLQSFLTRFPNSAEADSALLALGELQLKNYLATPSATNDLALAQSNFDQFVNTFTNSSLLGKAFLDRGWGFWIQGKWAESAASFQAATEKLPPSVDLAVARFKLADARFRLNQLTSARDNYQAVINDFTNYPVVGKALGAQALYQTLLVCLQLNDFTGATNALAQILEIYPVSSVAEESILLVGGSLSDLGQPGNARALYQKFEEEFPQSGQLPDVQLAIARTYEQQTNWPQAISLYNSWINDYSNSFKVPVVKYARAWANYQGGYETNAFLLFTNFLVEYPSNGLTPVAQWWLGDYYYSQGDWYNAETYYNLVSQNHSSQLSYAALLMAARAALGWGSYEATNYLLTLIGDTNCPPVFDAQALFTYGDVLMQEPSSDTNDPLANFKQAIPYFLLLCKQYSSPEYASFEWAPLACGEVGDCYLQLATQNPQYYSDATNAYTQVMASPLVGTEMVAARSQAQIGLGMVYEKLAALTTNSVDQTVLLHAALDNYLDVFFGNNLRNNETADPFWVKKSGLQALPLIESLGTGDPDKFIDQMEALLPQLKDSLEKKRLEIGAPKSP